MSQSGAFAKLGVDAAEPACAAVVLAIALVVFIGQARLDWPGTPHACVAEADCYCEAARPGWIRQPANTWSCLAGVLVGFSIAFHSAAQRRSLGGRLESRPTRSEPKASEVHQLSAGHGVNRMQDGPFHPALYASIVTYSGVAAAFFHASLTSWGGKLDMSSMILSFGFWLSYNVARVFGLARRQLLALFVGLVATLLVPRVVFDVLGFGIFAGLAAAVLLSEVLVARSTLRVRRYWLWVSLALYVPALGVWWLSLSGKLLCKPASLLQGHALWHVITALSPGALYLYFRNGEGMHLEARSRDIVEA